MNKEPKYNLPLTENEKDLIINALYIGSEIHETNNHPYVSNRMKKLADRLTHLNSERPQGEWKFSSGVTTQGSLKCSCCDYRDYHNTNSNFCPNCGADMRKGNRKG